MEDIIFKDNPVRIIDALVDKLDLDLLGFISKTIQSKEDHKLKQQIHTLRQWAIIDTRDRSAKRPKSFKPNPAPC